MLEAKNINLFKSHVHIVKDITCNFEQGILNGIIGINGSGKSMLVKSLIGLENSKGDVNYKGKKLCPEDFSYIPQDTELGSDPTVFETVLLGLYNELSWRVSESQIKRVNDIIEELELTEYTSRKLRTLSGGQRQMVFLAQSLIKNPKVILADEPTSALDLKNQLSYLRILSDYTVKNQATALVILHDLSLISRFADKIYVIEKGQLTHRGCREEIIKKESLERVYGVELEITGTKGGFQSILPIKVLD